MKILYVPLDERPCNTDYPQNVAQINNDIELNMLPKEFMGHKKNPGEINKIWEYIKENASNADYLVASAEMLLFGGLLPSRVHYLQDNDIQYYCNNLRNLKKEFPKLKIYLANLIMRTPRYSSDDEEPAYYGTHGAEIFKFGWLKDKNNRTGLSEKEAEEFDWLSQEVNLPFSYLKDYTTRRNFNLQVNLCNIQLVKEGIVDFMSIPQDDSADFGFTAMDQKVVYEEIMKEKLSKKIMTYPGADEVGYTLISRAYLEFINVKPTLYVDYSSTLGGQIVPLYEDRIISESLKAHVMAIGMSLTTNEKEADLILAYNTPGKIMQEGREQFSEKDVTYSTYRHLLTFVDKIQQLLLTNKPVVVCDCAYANGGDFDLVQLLDEDNLLTQLTGYCAWNTNCNSLGNSLSILACAFGKDIDQEKIEKVMLTSLIDDVIYQSKVRKQITDKFLPKYDLNYFDLGKNQKEVVKETETQINDCLSLLLPHTINYIPDYSIQFPWNRMFEIYCEVKHS